MTPIRKFITQFSHFFTGNALAVLLGFITFPILTRALSVEQYGLLGLVTTTMLIGVAIGKLGLSNSIIRFYENHSASEKEQTAFVSTLIGYGVIFSIAAVALYLAALPYLTKLLEISNEFIICFFIMAAYMFVRPLNIIVLNLLRVNDKTKFFNAINLAGKSLSVGLSLGIYFYILRTLYGYFIGVIAAEIIIGIILFIWFFQRYRVSVKAVSSDLMKKLIAFGLPLLFTELLYLLLSYADRYMLVWIHGEQALGIYNVGYNLAMYIGDMIAFALSYAVIPIYVQVFEREGKDQTIYFLERCLHYLLVAIIPVTFGYYAVSRELFIFLASEKYVAASGFSPIILLGTLLLGLNNILNAGLYLHKKAYTILKIMLGAVIINVLLNLVLIPSHAQWGAAVATLAACMITIVLSVLLSYKYLFIRIKPARILYHLGLSAIMAWAVTHVEMNTAFITILAKILVGAVIILIGLLIGEKEILKKLFNLKQAGA